MSTIIPLKSTRYDKMAVGYVAVHCDTGKELHVFERINDIRKVKEVQIVMGLYDIICKLETDNTKELEDAVMRIRKIPHVQTTMTLLVI
ncbi:MAG: Lrp/AsnC family transcriptional regulator [Thaumarchaeota archaeon]|nr:MAG: Lrp/AsnC family transcriptional regulator [Nitrososphaerota archaeon]